MLLCVLGHLFKKKNSRCCASLLVCCLKESLGIFNKKLPVPTFLAARSGGNHLKPIWGGALRRAESITRIRGDQFMTGVRR